VSTTRVEVASGVTLVHVTARNVSQEVVERPLIEIALPKGVRYRAVASAPSNAAVSVTRTDQGEVVEMVLPFALFEQEAAQVSIETSPLQETAPNALRARVRPVEDRLRVQPQSPAAATTPNTLDTGAVRQHLHPRE
jgi:hypothetical protein